MYENDCALEFRLNGDGESYSVTDTGKFYGETLIIPAVHNGKPVTAVREFAFRFCDGLKRVEIGGNIRTVGANSFYCCPVESVLIGARVEEIGENTFKKCPQLESITVESGNARYRAQSGCLIEIAKKTVILGCKNGVIPDDGSVTAIGAGAFRDQAGLESLTVPDCVTEIGANAFNGCASVTAITLGKGVKNIGGAAFQGCAALEKIKVSRKNGRYRSAGNCLVDAQSKTIIAGCRKSVIPEDTEVIGRGAFYGCTGLKSVKIPDEAVSVLPYAFYGCASLKAVEFGGGVGNIGENAFYGCPSLQRIEVAGGNKKYRAAENCLIEKVSRTLVLGCKDGAMPKDGSVVKIGAGAFRGYAFGRIEVPDGVTEICGYAFYACTELARITLPTSVRKIGGNVFLNCVALKNIDFGGTVAEWLETEKENGWNLGTGKYTVNCTDGQLNKYDEELGRSA